LEKDNLIIKDTKLKDMLFIGTGKFPNKKIIPKVIEAAKSQVITMALRRVDFDSKEENLIDYIPGDRRLLPNTSGARTAAEAVKIAQIARAAGCGNWVKIEVISDNKYLLPDNQETIKATEMLAKEGSVVLPYVSPDLMVAKKLVGAGAAAVMPSKQLNTKNL
jgi:thiazole synthase